MPIRYPSTTRQRLSQIGPGDSLLSPTRCFGTVCMDVFPAPLSLSPSIFVVFPCCRDTTASTQLLYVKGNPALCNAAAAHGLFLFFPFAGLELPEPETAVSRRAPSGPWECCSTLRGSVLGSQSTLGQQKMRFIWLLGFLTKPKKKQNLALVCKNGAPTSRWGTYSSESLG